MSLVLNSDEAWNCLGYAVLPVTSLAFGLDGKEMNFSQASRSHTLTGRPFRPLLAEAACLPLQDTLQKAPKLRPL